MIFFLPTHLFLTIFLLSHSRIITFSIRSIYSAIWPLQSRRTIPGRPHPSRADLADRLCIRRHISLSFFFCSCDVHIPLVFGAYSALGLTNEACVKASVAVALLVARPHRLVSASAPLPPSQRALGSVASHYDWAVGGSRNPINFRLRLLRDKEGRRKKKTASHHYQPCLSISEYPPITGGGPPSRTRRLT